MNIVITGATGAIGSALAPQPSTEIAGYRSRRVRISQ